MSEGNEKKEGIVRRIFSPQLRNSSSVSSFASDPGSDVERPPQTGRKRRRLRETLLRRGDGNRNNHLRALVSERQARQKYLNKLMRRDSIGGTRHGDRSVKRTSSGLKEKKSDDFHERRKDSNGAGPVENRAGQSLIKRSSSEGDDERDFVEKLAPPMPVKGEGARTSSTASSVTVDVELTEEQMKEMEKMSATLKAVKRLTQEYQDFTSTFPVEVRIENLTYTVPVVESSSKIKTVYNSSIVYKVVKFFKNAGKEEASTEGNEPSTKAILDTVSLQFRPGRMYLVLGPPGSGKTTLLKAIAGRLSTKHGEEQSGSVTYNGKSIDEDKDFHIENAISFIDQLDMHAPRLTVEETFEFAFQCKGGGTHSNLVRMTGGDIEQAKLMKATAMKADDERLLVNVNLTTLGLNHVQDTFVGDDNVRGVSGGQRRRVTAGEMMLGANPVLLGDEISNGLDASSTFEMIQILSHASKIYQRTRVISLLQPSPETVALFDEIILLAEGKVLFAGPISQVEDYFAKLGYQAPPYMDVADFLQLLSTPTDSQKLFNPPPELAETHPRAYSSEELADLFRRSQYGRHLTERLKNPHCHVWSSCHNDIKVSDSATHVDDEMYQKKYANSLPRSTMLNLKRNLTLWRRDRRVLIANAVKNIIMGISVGGIFFQTDDVVSILGVFFQGMLFIMLGAMTTAPGFVDERVIYYKQADANFFSSYPFVIGKAISKFPQVSFPSALIE